MALSRPLGTALFSAIAIAQAVRFMLAWPVTINGFSVPLWASALAAVAFGTLAVVVWRDGSTTRPPFRHQGHK